MSRRCLVIINTILVFFLLIYCTPTLNIRVVQGMPPRIAKLMEGKKRVGIIAVKTRAKWWYSWRYRRDWTATVQGAVENAFSRFDYYTLVDVSKRRKRLEEIAYSKSGMTRGTRSIGRELGADALLYLQMTNQPLRECKTEKVLDKSAVATNLAAALGGSATRVPTHRRVRVLYLAVYIKGTLINVETGRRESFLNKKPYRAEGAGRSCPSILSAFDKSLDFAANNIAKRLSPKVIDLTVPIETKDTGPRRKAVEGYLKQGVKWAKTKPPNYDRAEKSWERALEISGNKSAGAYWNLAILRWYKNDMSGADTYFKKAERLGGPDWLTSKKMDITSKFTQETKRKDRESEAADG